MILHGDGPLRHILGELTNTVYEEPTIDDFGEHGQLLSKGDGEVCPYTLFLGIFVSLLPKMIPMILSQLVADADLRAKYSDEHYEEEVEELFRQKFSNNLQMFEDIIQQWQDNSLNLADYGLDFLPAPLSAPLSRMDLGSMLSGHAPTTFQDNLLKGIEFLQYRIDRSRDNDDRITKMANGVWMVGKTLYTTIKDWFTGRPADLGWRSYY